MELIDVVKKLIGPVQPVAETRADSARLLNMTEMINLTHLLLCELETAALSADRSEHSAREIGQKAKSFIDAMKSA